MRRILSPLRVVLISVFMIAILIAVFLTVQQNVPMTSTAPALEAVSIVRPERRDLARTIILPGDIRAYQETDIHAKVSGYLKTITVDRGDWVKAGQSLAFLEIPEMDREYHRIEVDMNMKEKIYRRLDMIRNRNRDLLPLEQVEQARTEFEMAQASRDELTTMMGYATIRAPFDGVITTRHVHPGTLIQAGTGSKNQATPIVTVMDLDRVRIMVAVPESEVARITQETMVQLRVDARSDELFEGTVTRYATALDPGTRTMPTEIEVGNPKHLLYPGMYAHVTFTLEDLPNRLTIPRQAVRQSNNGQHVLIVEDGLVVEVNIRTGYEDALLVEVREGLTGAEQVIVQGHQRVRSGDRVTVRDATF